MDFFSAQDQARRTSRRLVFLYAVATLLIVLGVTTIIGGVIYAGQGTYQPAAADFIAAHAGTLGLTALLTLAVILGSSLYKTASLSSGGGKVAVEMGGTMVPADVQDPLRRRLRNVVEEMAIASGVPVPEIYVLEEEQSINAFAAGYSPADAAVAVTRGTLELLDRNELQGVIAHEFSHILNGDMKLNIRLMGVLFGIMVLGLAGRLILRGGYHSSIVSSRRDRNGSAIMFVGLGLVILGAVGVFFARLIKAGVSRQREYLADASAVQFTRQSAGIANALKKIGGYSGGSMITSADPEEVSHMLFGSGAKFIGMFATHPPLTERIRALDPNFTESDYPHVDPRKRSSQPAADERHAGFVGDTTTALATGGETVLAETIAESVGQPDQEHVEYAKQLRQSIPASLYDAAHSAELAYLLTVALVLDRSGRTTDRQLSLVREQLGQERAQIVQRYYDKLRETSSEVRLPLLEISFPALKLRPIPELAYLVSLASRIIEQDGDIELYEYCYYRIMTSNLGQAIDPRGKRSAIKASRAELRAAVAQVLSTISDYGHDNDDERVAAFRAGTATLGKWAQQLVYKSDRQTSIAKLDRSLDILLGLNTKGRESLLHAISAAASHDGHLAVAEAELIRAVCATLNYPLPPILVHRD